VEKKQMAHSLPFCKPPAPPESPLPAPRHINASPKSALLVENDESLLNFWRRSLTDEGYAVRTAANSEEGLRLFRDCGPFMVVLIDYCVPQRSGLGIDFLAPLTHGIGLATAIKEINPSQGIIVAALDYWNAAEVPRPQQLMHVPVLTDVSNFQLRRLLEKIEVERRIEMLTIPELLKLRRFGDFRVRGIGRAARGRTGEDLLGEAILRTLIGAENTQKGRHWNRDVDFLRHLAGAMQSICNCWKRQFNEIEAHFVSEFPVHDEEGQERSPLDNIASGHPPVDQCLIEKDEQSRVLSMFNDDHEAAQVLRGLLAGLTKSEIMLSYDLDKNKLAATERRIRVKLGRSDVSRGEKNGR
jgi:CheY-like chemotaxis protein